MVTGERVGREGHVTGTGGEGVSVWKHMQEIREAQESEWSPSVELNFGDLRFSLGGPWSPSVHV